MYIDILIELNENVFQFYLIFLLNINTNGNI